MDQHRRRRHGAKRQAVPEDAAPKLGVLALGIHPSMVANPDFIGVANENVGMGSEVGQLLRQLFRLPLVVRIQKSDPLLATGFDATIARRADTLILLNQKLDLGKLILEAVDRAIGRTVIDNDDLGGSVGLRQHRVKSPRQNTLTVEGRDDDTDTSIAGHL